MGKFSLRLRKTSKSAQVQDIDSPLAPAFGSLTLESPQPYLHLMRQVKKQPDALAVATLNSELTFRGLFERSKQIASVLRERGVQPGQVVVTALPSSENLPFLAAIMHEAAIGATAPLSVFDSKLNHMIDWLISTEYLAGFPKEKTILADQAFFSRIETATTILELRHYPSFDSVCRLVFSSGTTGTPKGIPFRIDDLEQRNEYSRNAWMSEQPFMSLIGLPAVTGFQTAYASLVAGQPFFTPGDGAQNLAMIARYKVAGIKGSPNQLAELMPEISKNPSMAASLRVAQAAGSFLPNQLAQAFKTAAGCKVVNLYGATEVGLIAKREEISSDENDVGYLVPGAQVEVVDEKDNPLPFGETGVIRWHRDFMSNEYFQNPEATAAAFKGKWFYPGDTGRLTAEGQLFLAGRSSELINAGGVKLNPAAIDDFLIRYPGVADGASFSYAGSLGVTAFALAVVVEPDFDRQGLLNAFKREFAGAAPSTIIRVPSIKRNEMRKVLRAELARDLERILSQQQARS